MSDLYRVLGAGSRSFKDRRAVEVFVLDIWHDSTQVGRDVEWHHGTCRGADDLFDRVLVGFGFEPVRHPADWDVCAGEKCKPEHRRTRSDGSAYCPTAGLLRDAQMVSLPPDEVLAWISPCTDSKCRRKAGHGSHGASHTADLADKAGIPVRRWPE